MKTAEIDTHFAPGPATSSILVTPMELQLGHWTRAGSLSSFFNGIIACGIVFSSSVVGTGKSGLATTTSLLSSYFGGASAAMVCKSCALFSCNSRMGAFVRQCLDASV